MSCASGGVADGDGGEGGICVMSNGSQSSGFSNGPWTGGDGGGDDGTPSGVVGGVSADCTADARARWEGGTSADRSRAPPL